MGVVPAVMASRTRWICAVAGSPAGSGNAGIAGKGASKATATGKGGAGLAARPGGPDVEFRARLGLRRDLCLA